MLVPGTEPAAAVLLAVARTDLCKGGETDLRVSFGKQGRSAFLRDAAASHENAKGSEAETESHRSVAGLINQIIDGGNSVRRPLV